MSTNFIPLNDGTYPCIQIGPTEYTTTAPPSGSILAGTLLYGWIDTYKGATNGISGQYFHAVIGNGQTAPVDYWFYCTSISQFTSLLSTYTVTNSYTSYAGCNGIRVPNGFATPITILVNTTSCSQQGYYTPSNQTTFTIIPNSKNYPQFQLFFTGNPLTDGASATASLAVPIAAVTHAVASTGTAGTTVGTVAAGDHLTITKNAIAHLYVVQAGDTAGTILTKTLAVLNTNTQGDTWTGVNTAGALVFTATNTLAAGATANGQVIATTTTGTTFSSDTGSTTSGGVTQTGLGDTCTGYLKNPLSGSPITLGVVTVVPGSTQSTLKTEVDALFNSNTLGFAFVGTLTSNVNHEAGTAPTKGAYYNGWTVSFTPTGATFGGSTVVATFTGGV